MPAGSLTGVRRPPRALKVASMGQLGRVLIVVGVGLAVVGALLVVGGKLGLGRLPGDIAIERKGFSLHFPIVTSIVLSLLLTLVVNLILRKR